MNVVLDANILLQAIAHNSRLRPIWNAFLTCAFDLHVTAAILLEYEKILSQKTSCQVAQSILLLIDHALNAHFTTIHYEWHAITADPDDNKFFDAAVAAGADYLVTNDRHFDHVKSLSFPKINIISSDEFLDLLSTLP